MDDKNNKTENTFCHVCGRLISNGSKCPYCHNSLSQTEYSNDFRLSYENYSVPYTSKRSALKAGFMQLFLGAFGIGRFYLGYKKTGMLQIAASFFSFGTVGFLWGLADGIFILSGKEKYDADGKRLL